MCEDSEFIECNSVDDVIQEHIFDKKMESISKLDGHLLKKK